MVSATLSPKRSRASRRRRTVPSVAPLATAAVVAGGLTIAAIVNRRLASKAEQNHPPRGQFIEVNGVRLHYVERGSGEPLVLLHGNGSMIEDFESSGLLDRASQNYRVIAFDRPGFGHSSRPRSTIWTPEKQAGLIVEALRQLGVSKTLVFGHSWGALVAIAIALKHPESVRGLVLASGYYYPSARLDIVGLSVPAVPFLGDLIAHTVAPLISRLLWPAIIKKIFGPSPVPDKFAGFPKEMALRPSQIRAAAAESAFILPHVLHFAGRYRDLKMPVAIVTGDEDQLVGAETQSARLHGDVAQSRFQRIPGHGHMIHQTATDAVLSAIHEIAEAVARAERSASLTPSA